MDSYINNIFYRLLDAEKYQVELYDNEYGKCIVFLFKKNPKIQCDIVLLESSEYNIIFSTILNNSIVKEVRVSPQMLELILTTLEKTFEDLNIFYSIVKSSNN